MAGRIKLLLAALLPTLVVAQLSTDGLTKAFLGMPECGVSNDFENQNIRTPMCIDIRHR
jgi:hypothetical protein